MSEGDLQQVPLEEAVVFALLVIPISMLTGSPATVAITTVVAVGVIIHSLKRQQY